MSRSRNPVTHESGLRWIGRAIVALPFLAIFALGTQALVLRFTNPHSVTGPAAQASIAYPRDAAGVFAARFALAYLTFDSAKPDERKLKLAPFLPANLDASAGWTGTGKQTAILALPASVDVRDEHKAVVTVAAEVDGGRWIYLAVPVAADQDALAVTGAPSLSAPPRHLAVPVSATNLGAETDPALTTGIAPSLEAFLRAYAASDGSQLDYYTTPDARLVGLAGTVQFADLVHLSVGRGPAATRRWATATVTWKDRASGAGYSLPYRLELVETGGKWLVAAFGPEL